MRRKIFVPNFNKSSVGLLIVAIDVGGISAQAAGLLNSPEGGYLICVNPQTQVVSYPGTPTCPEGSKSLVLGAQGLSGSGSTGATGATGATGMSSLKIIELSICGSGGTTLCKVGVQGPGGGTIFFVDYNDIYSGFNYLEAAPKSCERASKTWSSASTTVQVANGWAARAIGSGIANTAAIKAVFPSDTSSNNAAYIASSCTAGSKSDWFLGSLGEMKLMNDNLQGLGGLVEDAYWSSSENGDDLAWYQDLQDGSQKNGSKTDVASVRPIRAF